MTRPGAGGLLAAVGTIAAITVLARLAGFARTVVFSRAVGSGCTGSVYAVANLVPNVLYEVVAGGALAGAVVPVLAGMYGQGRRAEADRTASVLLTWTVLVLLLPAAALALAAPALGGRLIGAGPGEAAAHCPGAGAQAGRMLVLFAPQVVLYGVGVVLAGVLQARHRFAGPAVAPLLSSLVVIGCYLGYGALTASASSLGTTPGATPPTSPATSPATSPGTAAELVLAGGTTLGVAALSLPLLVPAVRSGVRLRPALRLPPQVGGRLRGLAFAGLGVLAAQQAATLGTAVAAGAVGGPGVVPVVGYLQAVYLLPYAVLAVPIATAALPRLSAAAARGDRVAFATGVALTTRMLVLVSGFGTALLIAVAPAVQALFQAIDRSGGPALAAMTDGLTVAALGLLGWGLVAHLPRVGYAQGRTRAAGTVTALGWLAALGTALAALVALPALGADRPWSGVVAVSAGTTLGLTLAGAGLLAVTARSAGRAALAGLPRAGAAAALAALVGAGLGRGTADALLAVSGAGIAAALVAGAGAAVVTTGLYGGVLAGLDRRDAAALAGALRRRRGSG